jgi:hypothetical protein
MAELFPLLTTLSLHLQNSLLFAAGMIEEWLTNVPRSLTCLQLVCQRNVRDNHVKSSHVVRLDTIVFPSKLKRFSIHIGGHMVQLPISLPDTLQSIVILCSDVSKPESCDDIAN